MLNSIKFKFIEYVSASYLCAPPHPSRTSEFRLSARHFVMDRPGPRRAHRGQECRPAGFQFLARQRHDKSGTVPVTAPPVSEWKPGQGKIVMPRTQSPTGPAAAATARFSGPRHWTRNPSGAG